MAGVVFGFLSLNLGDALVPLLLTTLVAAGVEAYTPADFDNLTVPLSALIVLWVIIPVLDGWKVPFWA